MIKGKQDVSSCGSGSTGPFNLCLVQRVLSTLLKALMLLKRRAGSARVQMKRAGASLASGT